MTIQISVLIWTIICFLLLVLILNRLLLKPVLQVMDARKERIQKAAQRKKEQERIAHEYEVMLQEKKAEYAAQQREQLRDEMEAVHAESRKMLEEANEKRLQKVEDYRVKMEAERAELLAVLSGHAEELAVTFASSIVKG